MYNKQIVSKKLSYTSSEPNLMEVEIEVEFSDKTGENSLIIKGIDCEISLETEHLRDLASFIEGVLEDIEEEIDV